MKLDNKVAIVSGGAQGIGLACARRFVMEGAKVVIADIDETQGDSAAHALKGIGGEAAFIKCDVSQKDQVDRLVTRTVDLYGRIDVLLNNAAVVHVCDFLDLEEADFDRVVDINLKGYFLLGQAVAREMVRSRNGGAIVNMSSVNAVMAIPSIASYVVCKGGVNQLTKVMALALASANIRVNAIGPGTIMTDLAAKVMEDPEAKDRIMSRTPMGRLGDPDEIAAIAVFLASDDASYMTGQCLYADGGRMALNYTVPVEA
ncbi:SDR family NAD(P)-dependent oxidoreductase [Varunaivibrio sulfuroxidans]|uniref:NAD(P)-dependent dehydrogenase (Short-subunit alcohol dehydrogenase family) n=1 Tax=Varunaivibrio sulfuroxidans TaxID=1773489 RepID=A0A4R3JD43_9PROT|nr:SDR family oxidoreductase [Varunaivibrio sulfuroxidans]TCS63116.1 NAD(P)-dependent dehydrogenase (short-subunit alcohol dehydrogenase family) [Varunaivibrio sulfuroxidans]WES31812.1 SDR family oxidoreductase [Varunaivibrio sulfuroxidans]